MAIAAIRRATGLSQTYARHVRAGHIPDPSHFAALATLAGVDAACPVPRHGE